MRSEQKGKRRGKVARGREREGRNQAVVKRELKLRKTFGTEMEIRYRNRDFHHRKPLSVFMVHEIMFPRNRWIEEGRGLFKRRHPVERNYLNFFQKNFFGRFCIFR